MSNSEPPPSSEPEIPGESKGAGLYLVGTLLLALGAAGLLAWRFLRSEPKPRESIASPAQTKALPASQEQQPLPPLHALPPPPKLEPGTSALPAGSQKSAAGADSAGSAAASGTRPGEAPQGIAPNPCAACGEGLPSAALTQAVQSAAASARACYKRALRSSEVSGSIALSVSIGSTGSVCSAAITQDTLGSAEISSCVLAKFQGKTFPAPKSGCVVINVPLKFEIQP